MKQASLRVCLYAPNDARYCRLRAKIFKGSAVNKKFVESDLSATGVDLNKFMPNGVLRYGEEVPEWMRQEVELFYTCSVEVATALDHNGTLAATPSRVITDMVREKVNHCKTSTTGFARYAIERR